jgi:hypothetical protein
MLECKDNNDRTKKDYVSVANILSAISDEKSLVLFNTIAIEVGIGCTGVSLSAINGSNATRIRNWTIRRRIQYSEIRLLTP